MSAALEDRSGGLMRGWPGGGSYRPPHYRYQPTFHSVRDGETPAAVVLPPKADAEVQECKHCYHDVAPLRMREWVFGETEMAICPECGAGLTPPAPVDEADRIGRGA